MRIEDGFLRTVVYICIDVTNKKTKEIARTPIGTGFRVAVPGNPGSSFIYVVTARHVLEDAQTDKILIRINRTDGGYEDIETDRNNWALSNTDDVAAIRSDIPYIIQNKIDVSSVHLRQFIDEDYRFRGPPLGKEVLYLRPGSVASSTDGMDVQAGDEVFFVGLFAKHAGKVRNLPIARFGAISAMPTEPVSLARFGGTSTFEAMAYLVESHSMGGHSGSPAFWTIPAVHHVDVPDEGQYTMTSFIIGFLGLVSAHFGWPGSVNPKAVGTAIQKGELEAELNAGIAVITPAAAIKELLMRDDLANEREGLMKRAKPMLATPDVVNIEEAESGPTREDFEAMLRKVSRRIPTSESESEKSETSQ